MIRNVLLCTAYLSLSVLAGNAHGQPMAEPEPPTEAAYLEALNQLFPVTPEQVEDVKQLDEALERAGRPRVAPARATSEAIMVSLEPGSSSPVVDLMHGFVTAIEVLDATGQPWPIVRATQGDVTAVSVTALTDGGGEGAEGSPRSHTPDNILTVSPSARFSATNLVITLTGASRPVSVILRADEASSSATLTDRITLIVDSAGPMALARVNPITHLDAGEDLRNVLVGRSPSGEAEELIGDLPAGLRAWREGSVLWVRTNASVISPAPSAQVAMGDVQAFRLRYRPVIVVSTDGRLNNVTLAKSAQAGVR